MGEIKVKGYYFWCVIICTCLYPYQWCKISLLCKICNCFTNEDICLKTCDFALALLVFNLTQAVELSGRRYRETIPFFFFLIRSDQTFAICILYISYALVSVIV
jgi:hypothetical protein